MKNGIWLVLDLQDWSSVSGFIIISVSGKEYDSRWVRSLVPSDGPDLWSKYLSADLDGLGVHSKLPRNLNVRRMG